ncbi:MAG: DUF6527 family protein [Kouleothrix sp.]
MEQEMTLRHEFVDYIPDDLKEGIIYISVMFATVAHKCCCGCGNEVVTPLSPTDWELIFDGESISLYPSIGNWSFACRSHYWIKRNRVKWAGQWSQKEINAGRTYDLLAKERYFATGTNATASQRNIDIREPKKVVLRETVWQRLKNRFLKKPLKR